MKDLMGIITAPENFKYLQDITADRVVAAVPYGGRYRLIDFILSNMVNSGIQNVGLFIGEKSRSLLDHLRSGKDWDLHRKRNGLFILPTDCSSFSGTPMGNLEYFYKHLDYFHGSTEKYVLIGGSNTIFNTTFNKFFKFHMDNNADVTIIYSEYPQIDPANSTTLEIDAANRVIDIKVNPSRKKKSKKISMEIYLMKKELLMDITDTCVSKGQSDLTKDGIIKNIKNLNVYAYRYTGYFGKVTSLTSYYHHNMALLNPEIWTELFFESGPIYTKVKNEPPTKYTQSSKVLNSLIASGCIIEGQVENSILFRGARVFKNSTVKKLYFVAKI
ncbi:glucose-1-phosphate adenylyltransferase subunit GlgD [Desulfitibacter alkalitolerans]|uniref:glucose-1-phosphate adenylyltransferase subunit GlgD n=1 Tax=Desulfitibacter alkalitolerans TaxID=264641 RepID=UPI0006848E71|nr:glucose-1-phosphate adenylyltransferase subunit GlgD [Desulfitibacter alkalitolerans]